MMNTSHTSRIYALAHEQALHVFRRPTRALRVLPTARLCTALLLVVDNSTQLWFSCARPSAQGGQFPGSPREFVRPAALATPLGSPIRLTPNGWPTRISNACSLKSET